MKAVLIIDDDLRNMFALSAVLKAKDFTTFTAHNMVETFAVLQSEKQIGIILLDIMMPGMDGYEAITVLKSNGNLPVIVDALVADLNKYLK